VISQSEFIDKTMSSTGGTAAFDGVGRLWLANPDIPMPPRNALTDPGWWSVAFPPFPGQTPPDGATVYTDFIPYHRPPILPPTALQKYTTLRRWLPWAFGRTRGKAPLHCHKIGGGSDLEPESWGTLEEANQRYRSCTPSKENTYAVDGVGIVMWGGGDDLWAVDFDCYKSNIPDSWTVEFDAVCTAKNLCSLRTPSGGRRVFGWIHDRDIAGILGAQTDMLENAVSIIHCRAFVTVTNDILVDGELKDLSPMATAFLRRSEHAGSLKTVKPLESTKHTSIDTSHISDAETDPVIQHILTSGQADTFKKLFYEECRDDAWMENRYPRGVDPRKAKDRSGERDRDHIGWRRYGAWLGLATIIKGFRVPDDVAVSILQRSWMTCDGKADALRGDLYSRVIAKVNEKNVQEAARQAEVYKHVNFSPLTTPPVVIPTRREMALAAKQAARAKLTTKGLR